MRLFEIMGPKHFLCTDAKQKVGALVSTPDSARLLSGNLENVLEERRPDGCLSRTSSVFVAEKLGGSRYNYEVAVIGPTQNFHTGWLKRLAASDPSHSGVLASCASGYWSAAECPDERDEPWETLAAEVEIIQRAGAWSGYTSIAPVAKDVAPRGWSAFQGPV